MDHGLRLAEAPHPLRRLGLGDLSWTLATTLPPDRSDIDPTLSAAGRQDTIDLRSDPLTWIPLLIDALPSSCALSHLSSTFCATPLTSTFDPSTSTLDHDLETVIGDTPPAPSSTAAPPWIDRTKMS